MQAPLPWDNCWQAREKIQGGANIQIGIQAGAILAVGLTADSITKPYQGGSCPVLVAYRHPDAVRGKFSLWCAVGISSPEENYI